MRFINNLQSSKFGQVPNYQHTYLSLALLGSPQIIEP